MAIPPATASQTLQGWSVDASRVDAQEKALFVRLRKSAPASMTAHGQTGDVFFASTGIYYCYAPDSWKFIAGSNFP